MLHIASILKFKKNADEINEKWQKKRKSANDVAEVKLEEWAQWVKTSTL